MRFRTLSNVLVLTGLQCCLLANLAGAQVISTGSLMHGTSSSGTGTFLYNQGSVTETTNLGTFSGVVGLNAVGDWSLMLPRSAEVDTVDLSAVLQFTVGFLPVQIDALNLDVDAKWVNGGGTSAMPDTTLTIEEAVVEALIPGFYFTNDPKVLDGSFQALDQLGNGLIVDGLNYDSNLTYTLAAGRTYYLLFDFTTRIDASTFAATDPSVTVTNEYGGSLSAPAFSGIQMNLLWHTVPEPSTLASSLAAIAAMGVFAGLRKCRMPRLQHRAA